MILIVKKLLGYFVKKGLQKTSQKEFKIEKVIKRKGNGLYVKWKEYDNSFSSCLDKKDILKLVNIFLKDKNLLVETLMLKFDLPNYARKADLKNATGIETSKFGKMVYLASLNSNVDHLALTN